MREKGVKELSKCNIISWAQKPQNFAIWPFTENSDLCLQALMSFMGFFTETGVLKKTGLLASSYCFLQEQEEVCDLILNLLMNYTIS